MTTNTVITPAPAGRGRAQAGQERRSLASEAKKSLTSRIGSVVAVAHRDRVDAADLRPVRLVVPARGRDQDHRLVDVLPRPGS